MKRAYSKTLILFIIPFALISCGGGNAKQSQAGNASADWPAFFGEWHNDDVWETEGVYFHLEFKSENDTLQEIRYYARGPFEELLTGRLISETKAELYFDFILGSISFAEAQEYGDAQLAECRKKKVADCTLNSDGTMTVITYTDECGQIPANQTIILRRDTGNDADTGNEGKEDGDMIATVVADYTPGQIQKLTGKPRPEGIGDLFLLLPDEACAEYFSPQDRQKMLRGERDNPGSLVVGEIITNGNNQYMNLAGALEGVWEMSAHRHGDSWDIAVNVQSCAPVCVTDFAARYRFANGQIIRYDHVNLAGFRDVFIEMFITLDQLTQAQQEQVSGIWGDVFFRLHSDGETITMFLDPLPYMDAGIPETAFMEIEKDLWEN